VLAAFDQPYAEDYLDTKRGSDGSAIVSLAGHGLGDVQAAAGVGDDLDIEAGRAVLAGVDAAASAQDQQVSRLPSTTSVSLSGRSSSAGM
jgi:hypothetical protein